MGAIGIGVGPVPQKFGVSAWPQQSVGVVGGAFEKVGVPETQSRGSKVVKAALIGALGGVAAGIGVSLLTHIVPLPIAAAIGGVAGLALGGLIGFLRSRNDDAPVAGVVGGSSFIQGSPPAPVGAGTNGLPPQI